MSTTEDLLIELYVGCRLTPKRWSGDCGEPSRVDEQGTDELMRRAAAEIERLERELAAALRELERMEAKVRLTEANLGCSRNERNHLRDELATAQAERDQLRAELAQARQTIEDVCCGGGA